MLLFDILISPIELLIRLIFLVSYNYTSNYIAATLTISATVSLALLPFYYWAESIQKKEKDAYNKVKPSIDEFKRVYKGSELHAVTRTLFKQNNYHPAYSLRSLAGLLIQLPIFIAAYNFLSVYEPVKGIETFLFNDLGSPDGWLEIGYYKVNVMPLLMTAINLIAGYKYYKNPTRKDIFQLWSLAIFFLILLYNSPSILLLYWTSNNLFYLMKIIVDNIRNMRSTRPAKIVKKLDPYGAKVIKLSLFICFLLLFLLPTLQIISSSPDEFPNRGILIGLMLYSFLLTFLLSSFLLSRIKGLLKRFFLFSTLFICFLILVNYFVFNIDYGFMDFFIFHKPERLELIFNKRYSATVIGILFLTSFFLFILPLKFITRLLFFISLTLVLSSLISLGKIVRFSYGPEFAYGSDVSLEEIQSKFRFSKDGKNVLIIFFDRLVGGFVPDILKDIPDLKTNFKGFTWYPNTISPGSGTPVGLPAILGGYAFSDIEEMQASGHDWAYGWAEAHKPHMQKRFIDSYRFLTSKFINAGYRSFVSDPTYIHLDFLTRLGPDSHAEKLLTKYTNLFYADTMLALKESINNPISLITSYLLPFSVFKVSPPIFRKSIYNEGSWWSSKKFGGEAGWIEKYVHGLALAKAWPYLSIVDDTLRGSYMFAKNEMTHDTYAALDNGRFQTLIPSKGRYTKMTISSDEEMIEHQKLYNSNDIPEKDKARFNGGLSAVHFYSAKEALVRTSVWLNWMKEHGVYDNTKIVIVSDHGFSGVVDPMFDKQIDPNLDWYSAYHSVLMTKDYNARGDLKIDDSFMTIADVPAFVLTTIEPDAMEKYSANKQEDGFRLYTKEGNMTVRENIFDPQNWVYTP